MWKNFFFKFDATWKAIVMGFYHEINDITIFLDN